MLIVKNLSKSYADHLIFKDVNFSVSDGDKIAVTGLNGAGKSTLIKIIANNLHYNDGDIEFIPSNQHIGWMPQTIDELEIPDDISVYDFLYSGRPVKELATKINDLYLKLSKDSSDYLIEELEKSQNQFEYYGGYTADIDLEKLIANFKIPKNILNKKMIELSGGQKSKLSFLRTLYSAPSFLILDEPTNHLDKETKDWVIDYLKNLKISVLFVSHDEDFLNKLANKILYIDNQTKSTNIYNCSYQKFLSQVEENNLHLEKQLKNQSLKIEHLQKFIDTQKGKSGKMKRQAQSKEKLLDKMKENMLEPPKKQKEIKIDLKVEKQETQNPIEVHSVNFGYTQDKPVIKNAEFEIEPNERFIIIGANGAGKSTMLKLMAGLLKSDKGSIKVGNKTKIGYYEQEHSNIDEKLSILDAVSSVNYNDSQIRTILGSFNFKGDKVFQEVKTLSPGERSRLEIARLCIAQNNLLLLDEPTNHLDIPTKKIMAKALTNYGGTLVIVSHDLPFLEDLQISRMLMLPSCKIRFYDKEIIKKYMDMELKKENKM